VLRLCTLTQMKHLVRAIVNLHLSYIHFIYFVKKRRERREAEKEAEKEKGGIEEKRGVQGKKSREGKRREIQGIQLSPLYLRKLQKENL
jgi:hypothetical protein